MILIPKRERNTTNPSNYRLISLLENIGKIIERKINERIQGHFEKNNLLNERQFSFRKRRNCLEVITLVSEFTSQLQRSRKFFFFKYKGGEMLYAVCGTRKGCTVPTRSHPGIAKSYESDVLNETMLPMRRKKSHYFTHPV